MVLAEEGTSYMQPVLVQGKMQTCYVIPGYEEGRITYPLKRQRGELIPWKINKEDDCDPLTSLEQVQTVIQADKAGDKPEIIPVAWRTDKAHPEIHCPVVPFFDDGKIVPRLVANNEVKDICMGAKDWMSFNNL